MRMPGFEGQVTPSDSEACNGSCKSCPRVLLRQQSNSWWPDYSSKTLFPRTHRQPTAKDKRDAQALLEQNLLPNLLRDYRLKHLLADINLRLDRSKPESQFEPCHLTSSKAPSDPDELNSFILSSLSEQAASFRFTAFGSDIKLLENLTTSKVASAQGCYRVPSMQSPLSCESQEPTDRN